MGVGDPAAGAGSSHGTRLACGSSTAGIRGEAHVERELFSIEQSARGWVVYTTTGGNEPPDPTPLLALEHADQLACARHRRTGRPTGVKVKLRCGDTVLVACHG